MIELCLYSQHINLCVLKPEFIDVALDGPWLFTASDFKIVGNLFKCIN